MAFVHSEEAYDMSLFETEEVNIEEKNKEAELNKELAEENKAVQNKRKKYITLQKVLLLVLLLYR